MKDVQLIIIEVSLMQMSAYSVHMDTSMICDCISFTCRLCITLHTTCCRMLGGGGGGGGEHGDLSSTESSGHKDPTHNTDQN